MGMTIKVDVCKLDPRDDGEWRFSDQQIKVSASLSDEGKCQAFWHEAVHACLEVMSYDKLSKDEAFVDRLGHCLAQIEQTRK